MKFINRKDEMKRLEEYHKLSKKQLMVLAISGLRRVGKTTLIKEHLQNRKSIYFFIYESKTSEGLLKELSEELRIHGILTELEAIDSWHKFFEILFKRCSGYTLVFDEFQNFYTVDKTIFSILQKKCDEHKRTPINLVILGSLIGLFTKVFEDKKEPLYGRVSTKLRLKPFSIQYSMDALKHLEYDDFEQMLYIYSVFGGYPKYYAAIEQFNLLGKKLSDVLEYLFIQENAPLENEVVDILRQEFGRRSSLYYAILHAIARGKTKLTEIANATHMKESSITRHLAELEDKFGLIRAPRPIDNKKNTRYYISHPLILFWFRFIYAKFSEYKIKATKQIMHSINADFNTVFGRRFEGICREFLIAMDGKNRLPFKLEYLSNWWGTKRTDGEREEIDIDLLALNETAGNALFIECKWKSNVDAGRILKDLREKSKYVNWHKNKRENFYCIIAKSFKKRIKEKNVLLFDLKDIEKTVCGKEMK